MEEINQILVQPVEGLASTNPNITSLKQPSDYFGTLLFLIDWQVLYITNLFFFFSLLTAAIAERWITLSCKAANKWMRVFLLLLNKG